MTENDRMLAGPFEGDEEVILQDCSISRPVICHDGISASTSY